MSKTRLVPVVMLLFCSVFATVSWAQEWYSEPAISPGVNLFQERVAQIAESHDAAGMAVIGSCGDETVSAYTGLRDIGRGLPVDRHTYFRIASVSKMVTALAVLYLHNQGDLDLHVRADEWLDFTLEHPQWPGVPIHVLDLLTHRSGIQDGDTYSAFLQETAVSDSPPPISSLLETGAEYYAPNNWRTEQPGTYFMYSNLNYGLLGSVIEIASGQRFDHFMRDTFLPLIEVEGSFNVADLEDIDRLAVLYRKPGGIWTPQFDHFEGQAPPPRELPGYEPGHNGLIFSPQGGLRTTAEGLVQVAELLHGQGSTGGVEVIGSSVMAYMLEPQWVYDGSNGDTYFDLYFAFGSGSHHTTNRPGKDIVVNGHAFTGHPGSAYGLASVLYIHRETASTITILTNGIGNGFTTDNRSSFYTFETDIFEAWNQEIFGDCQPITHVTEEESETPESRGGSPFQHVQLYPNPFNSRSVLSWDIQESGHVHVRIFDITGRLIRDYGSRFYPSGRHILTVEADSWASGHYMIHLSRNSDSKSEIVRMSLIR